MPAKSPSAKNESLSQFESKLEELEQLVRELESGDAPLEQAVKHFERGMALSKSCESLLKQAELRVQQLSNPADPESKLEDWQATNSEKTA